MSQPKIFTPSFVTLMVCNFLGAMNFYLLTAIFTEFSLKTYSLDYSTAALSVSLYIIGALLARFLLGGQIDNFGIKRSLLAGYLILAVTSCTYVLRLPFALLVSIRFVQGIGFGVSSGAAAAGASLLVPKSRMSEGIGYFSMAQALATGIGPFVAIMLINLTGDYQALFATAGIAAVVTWALSILVKLPEAINAADARNDAPGDASRLAETGALKERPYEGSVTCQDAADSSAPKGIWRFLHPKVLPFGFIMFMAYLCYAGLITYITLYAGDLGFSSIASFYFVVYAAAILISRPPMGRMADRRGENSVVRITLPALALGMVALGAAGTLHIGALMLVSAALTGFGIGSTQSVLQAVVPRTVPQSELGLGNSTYFIMLDLGSGVGPVLLGLFLPYTGYELIYYLLGAWALLALAAYYPLHGRKAAKR